MNVRPVRNKDAPRLVDLLSRCFSEYPGVVVEPDGVDSDLNTYATALENLGGEGYVLDEGDRIVALVSGAPLTETTYQLKRIYLDASLRGTGAASRLLDLIEGRARALGAKQVELWSDTRFARAHRFYEREGYARTAETRLLNDASNTEECQFIKAFGKMR